MDTDTLRVLSWNLQKHRSSSDYILKHLAAWGCEIACLQEPIAGFRKDLTIREWECRWFPDADCSLVYVKSKVKLTKVDLVVPKERPIDANTRAYLVAECARGAFKGILVTCHSPYKEASGNATVFMQQLFTGLKAKYAANVVIIAGDTNIYGPHKLDRITTDLVCALASPTSNKGQGSPLDQVYLSKKALLCCPHVGRVVMPKMNPKKLTSADAASSRVKDFEIEYDTQLYESDHIPIYIDVTAGHGASAGAASAAAGAAGGAAAMDEGNASELAREAAKLAAQAGRAADLSAEALAILGRCEALLKKANLGEASSATAKAAAESIYTVCSQLGHGNALPKARAVVTALQSHASAADVREKAKALLAAWAKL